jgi:PPOX class probable F420-dependent enzyme
VAYRETPLNRNVNLPKDILTRLLDTWPVATLSTITAQQYPHLVPIVFCEFQGSIYSPIDGKRKSGRQLQRLKNLNASPGATLLLDHYSSDWENLWWVRIDGKAGEFSPSDRVGREIVDRLLRKYPQYSDPSLMFDPSSYLRLAPSKVSAWSQSGSVTSIEASISELLRA